MAAEVAIPAAALPLDPPYEPKPVNALVLQSLKRTYELFAGNFGQPIGLDEDGQRLKISCKMADEYAAVEHLKAPDPATARPPAPGAALRPVHNDGPVPSGAAAMSHSATAKLIDSMPAKKAGPAASGSGSADGALVVYSGAEPGKQQSVAQVLRESGHSSAAVSRRLASKWPKPAWHAPWKMYRVISGHLGWVRSIAIDPGNEWFVTGSADRTIKIWDMASAQLKLTLTGHIEQVTGLAVSDRHPYMFSCGLDKQVKCWDLEQNKVIRNYHGHLSGIYAIALHPTLDVLFTGGRDSVCRVWDMRTRLQIHCLSGHDQTVCSVMAQGTDPQVITGSHDGTIRLWDLRKAKTAVTLTHHKKSVRAMALHPSDYAFGSASADNIKKYKLPDGEFLHNMLQNQKAIVNTMAINEDNVMATGGDDGSLWFWDWTSGHCFQQDKTQVQPGSLESESGIHAVAFDRTGGRLITCETDKTIKMWKENDLATPESHPGETFRPPKDIKRF